MVSRMRLPCGEWVIRSWRPDDAPALRLHADDRRVWINLRDSFPHPYTDRDAREWVRLGHSVQIVAASHSHVRARQPAPGDQLLDGIHYRWLRTPAYQGNGLGRAWNIANTGSATSTAWIAWRRRR